MMENQQATFSLSGDHLRCFLSHKTTTEMIKAEAGPGTIDLYQMFKINTQTPNPIVPLESVVT